ncbi:MAG: hypothetical protein NTW10_13910 [Bacteroidetes bacterium]|nr:hypothetical protein [Bacteroidota bacterium]
MKTFTRNLCLMILLIGVTLFAKGQNSNEWQMLLNNDHSPFKIKMLNREVTFYFSYVNDTITFSQVSKKAIKSGFTVEISLKNNNKVVFTSDEKSLSSDKMRIIIPMMDVHNALKNIKVPVRPKYVISIKDKTTVKEKLFFEFVEK